MTQMKPNDLRERAYRLRRLANELDSLALDLRGKEIRDMDGSLPCAKCGWEAACVMLPVNGESWGFCRFCAESEKRNGYDATDHYHGAMAREAGIEY